VAGLYVGDSRRAHVTITGNLVHDNGAFGIFLRDARRGEVSGNTITANCLGIIVLDTPSPGRAGDYRVLDNTISGNTSVCPGPPGEPTATGGIGLAGARGVTVEGNTIERNRPSGPVDLRGGVILVQLGRSAPVNNTVTGNTLVRNRPNVFWDGSGSGNVIEGNDCTPGC
jgi:parallel beta-helix repeat protein